MTTNSNVAAEVGRDEATGLNKAVVTLNLPVLTITAYARDEDDLRYKVQSQFNEIVDEMISSAMKN